MHAETRKEATDEPARADARPTENGKVCHYRAEENVDNNLCAWYQACENLMVLSQFARLRGRNPGASLRTFAWQSSKWLRAGLCFGAAKARKTAWCWFLAIATPLLQGQTGFTPQGVEYGVAGTLAGDQVFPTLSLKTSGGYLVWQDNRTDGDGLGISALRLDSSFSAPLSSFRVNEHGEFDQSKPAVSLLNDGGAVFAWQGGRQGFQHIYARFLTSSNTWLTGDVAVNTFTNDAQINPAVATLSGGDVIIVWGSFNQQSGNSLQDVYAQRFSPAGQKLGNEFLVNLTTAYNQRSAAVAALSDGRYVVVWVSEQQRSAFNQQFDWTNGAPPSVIGTSSVDIYARLFNASGAAATDEFLINSGTDICASPSVAPSSDGGFTVAWMQKNVQMRTDSWDIFARPFSAGPFGASGGLTRRVNTETYGDQFAPKISAIGSDYLVVWTSLGQDGSREGVYGQFLYSDGSHAGGEFRVNARTISQQMHPALASDGAGRFLTVWTSFVGGVGSFDLFAQRYVSTNNPVHPPDPPFVTVLSSNSLSVTWPTIGGLNVANYEIYADGAVPPLATAVIANNIWTATGLAPNSSHSYRLAYVLTDGRRSPLSGATTNRTYGALTYSGIPVEWMAYFFGDDWPLASADSDGDGASNKSEFLAGTDPTDPNSVLRIRLNPTAQGLYLNWNTQAGLIYQVQTAANPGGAWTNLGGQRLARGNVDSLYVGGSTAGYYRIVRGR
jgi:hypothetical protein